MSIMLVTHMTLITSLTVEVNCVSREVKNALRRMKKGKVVGSDELSVEVWKCIGEMERAFDPTVQQTISGQMDVRRMKRSVPIPIYKNKGDAQCFGSYRGKADEPYHEDMGKND